MLSDEEKKEYEELKSLLYTGTISQYGKRKLIDIIEKQSKEIEEYKKQLDLDNECEIDLNSKVMDLEKEIEEAEQKERKAYIKGTNDADELCNKYWKDKIKAKIEELEKIIEFEKPTYEDVLKYAIEILQSLLKKE